ncbi:MAG TPA: substrate-binding domain-containing protein [Chloroflexia bacterium]|nr:substrate-binding domain-containing protein [Chloroflexia bacterium]
MRRNQLAFILFLLIAGGAVVSQFIFKWSKGTLLNPTPDLNITVTYSAELREWLQPAADAFNAQRKKVGDQAVHVELEPVDDGDAMRDILAGRRKPTAWIPASTIWVNLLNNQWRPTHQADLLLRSGEYAATSLVRTPMVFVMYARRAEAFQQGGRKVDWLEIQKAVTNPQGWQGLGGDPLWGPVKYSQPDPSSSNAGLLAVTLATYTYFASTGAITQTSNLDSAKLDDTAYRQWINGLAGSLVSSAPKTASQQIEDMLQLGESSYDVVCIYESLVAQRINTASTRFGTELKVFYPSMNIWSDYPFSILVSEESTAEDKDGALLLRQYLYSPQVQQGALNAGFRPANPDVPLLNNNDANNPFNKYKDAGLQIDIPRTAITDPPSGEVVNRLMSVFQR